MTAFWTEPDYDDHELVQLVRDPKSGLTAIIALHSTHLGPGAGGTRFWHYAEPEAAMRDALRVAALSRFARSTYRKYASARSSSEIASTLAPRTFRDESS